MARGASWSSRPALAFAVLLAVAVVAFFAARLGQADAFLYRPGSGVSDLTLTFWPNIVYIQRSLAEGHGLPLWRDSIFGGTPFDADPQSGLWYPPNVIFLVAPAAVGFNLLFVLHAVAGGLGMWRWARAVGVSVGGAAVAGLAYTFAPRPFAHLGFGHVGLFYAAAYVPWALWAASRIALGSRRHIGALGLALGLQAIAHVQLAAYTAATAIVYCLATSLLRQRPGDNAPRRGVSLPPALLGLAVGGALALAVSAAQLIPSLRFAPLTARASLGEAEAAISSLPLRYLWGLLLADYHGFMDSMVYAGLPVLVLAILALPRRRALFWWAFVILAVVYALGPLTPLYGWVSHLLPGQTWLRAPTRVWFVASAALSLLAGLGLDRLLGGLGGRARYALNLVAAGLAAAALLIVAGDTYLLAGWPPANFIALAVIAPLTAALCIAGASGRLKPIWGVLLAALLVLADLWVMDATLVEGRPPQTVFADSGLAASLAARADETPFRVFSPSYSLRQPLSGLYGLETTDGVDPLYLADYDGYVQTASGIQRQEYGVTVPPIEGGLDIPFANSDASPDPAMLGLLNVRYVAAEFPLQAQGLREVARLGDTWLYQNDFERPRAFVVGTVDTAGDFIAALDWVKAHAGEPQAVVESGPPLASGVVQAEVTWAVRSPNRLVLDATLDRPGLLVISQVWYPDWQATVDGRAEPLWRTDGVLSGVYLPPGTHRVELDYRPPLLWLGVGLSIVGWIACLVLIAQRRRKT